MKLVKWILGASFVLSSASSNAAIGNEAGGGGSYLESAFRLTATSLITRLRDYPAAQNLCSSDVMQRSLDRTKILIVNRLTDLNTGKPVTDSNLDAWTRPGTMQLKEQVWSKYIDGNGRYLDMSVSALILHEVYRTTLECDDDNGSLSTAVARLLVQGKRESRAEKFNKLYTLKYAVPVPKGYSIKTTRRINPMGVVCEAPVNLAKPKAAVYCFGYGDIGADQTGFALFKTDTRGSAYSKVVLSKFSFPTAGDGPVWGRVSNLIHYVSVEMPFYVVFNIGNGGFYYGIDLERMYSAENNM